MLSHAKYIKANNRPAENSSIQNPAPRFRKVFTLPGDPVAAQLYCTGLGIGYFYLNGKPVAGDLFTAPVSAYHKTVWYCGYDVTGMLVNGDNVLAAELGNGFYNETFKTAWDFDKAPWRDIPKLIARLVVTMEDGSTWELVSDGSWKCREESPWLFNSLRSGEHYDARLEEPGWTELSFDDREWLPVCEDPCPPTGVLRLCECEPIREFENYVPERIFRREDAWVFCFPKNISGYVRVNAKSLHRGQKIVIRYAEDLNAAGELEYFNFYPHQYPETQYATMSFIANGEDVVWTPKFSYYGFRYVEVLGLEEEPPENLLQAVFVHQDLEVRGVFACSDAKLNRLYDMGIRASQSNMFYGPTDCPTREKLGWCNDTQASMEQFLINFKSEKFWRKWFQDVLDAQREDGELPGIVPTSGWGYEWGTGPISTGVLFELPWRVYQYTGDNSLIYMGKEAFLKHLAYIRTRANQKGFPDYGLCDWAGPWETNESSPVPRTCTNALLYIRCLRITALSLEAMGEDTQELKTEEARVTDLFLREYFTADGKMIYPYQTALSMCMVLEVYPDKDVLSHQLVEVIHRDNCHINCGMLGIQYLYDALECIGRQDLAYAIVTAEGFPSYFSWIDQRDATTLCETWRYGESQNHHMYSNVLAWMMKTLGGIRPESPGFADCVIKPYFPKALDWCQVCQNTVQGEISVAWERNKEGIQIKVFLPKGIRARLCAACGVTNLTAGETILQLPD